MVINAFPRTTLLDVYVRSKHTADGAAGGGGQLLKLEEEEDGEDDNDNDNNVDGMKENLHRCKHTQEKEQWPGGGQLIKLWPLWSVALVRALNASILLACHS